MRSINDTVVLAAVADFIRYGYLCPERAMGRERPWRC
jgi:hypothetical protein